MKRSHLQGLLAVISIGVALFSSSAIAWEHGIAAGFGGGKEIDQDYYNTDYVLSAKLYKFKKIDDTLIAVIEASFSKLQADTDEYNSMYAAAIALSLRGYFLNPEHYRIKPYLEISSGPAYLSEHQLGNNIQGSHLVIQSTLGGGFEFGKNHSIDLNFHFAHYCNAGLADPNQGFDFPFIISLGYLW